MGEMINWLMNDDVFFFLRLILPLVNIGVYIGSAHEDQPDQFLGFFFTRFLTNVVCGGMV